MPTDGQRSLLECEFLLPPAKVARLKKSWAEPFRERILPLIDEEVLRAAYSDATGRPNKSIRLLVGLHVLKAWNDLTDEQVLEHLEFNLQWHYALGVEPGPAHVCEKTLHNFRLKLMDSDRAKAPRSPARPEPPAGHFLCLRQGGDADLPGLYVKR